MIHDEMTDKERLLKLEFLVKLIQMDKDAEAWGYAVEKFIMATAPGKLRGLFTDRWDEVQAELNVFREKKKQLAPQISELKIELGLEKSANTKEELERG